MISWLLHHANKLPSEQFYKIKDKLLKPLPAIAYDLQIIHGKECYACESSGLYVYYDDSPHPHFEDCHHCWGTGYYKLPKWILLKRVRYGKYEFHIPLKRHQCVSNPFTKEELGWDPLDFDATLNTQKGAYIVGYIKHGPTRYSELARTLLIARYNPRYFIQKFISHAKTLIPNLSLRLHQQTITTDQDLPF